ncbi:hypothetical protein OF83DRAFT_1085140 [Amylostereum chailletii]|nr:hypothetical protein OF83DRAFT_1085140 [Amylostereum chailletii]
MFSLAKIATFITLALGTFVSAVPVEDHALQARQTDSNTVSATLDASNATVDSVAPIVTSANSLIQDAIAQLSTLPTPAPNGAGDPIQSLANILTTVLTPSNALVTLSGVDSASLIPIFAQLGTTLAQLIGLVVGLVEAVLTLVVQLLQGLVSGLQVAVTNLQLGDLASLLGL